MKHKLLFVSFMLLAFSVGKTKAQELTNYNLYVQNPFLYNPAYTIDDNELTGFLNSHMQWIGFENAPRINTFGVHGQMGENSGVGLSVSNITSGLVHDFKFRLNYAYQAMFDTDHYLKLGVAGGFMDYRLTSSNDISDPTDAVLTSDVFNGSSFSSSTGLAYFYKGAELQLILPLLYNRGKLNGYNISMLAYNYELNPDLTLKPSVVMRNAKYSPAQFEMNLMGTWQNKVWLQAGYRTSGSIATAVGVHVSGVEIGYAYQMEVGKLSLASGGTHELQLVYRLGQKLEDRE